MLTKSFDITHVEDDGGEIVAYAATFDRVPDSYGDVIAKGAFAQTLRDWESSGNPIPLLFGHRTDDPRMNVGAVEHAEEDDHGLLVRARFDADSDVAQYTRKLVLEGRLAKLSFAYETLDQSPITLDDGSRANELRRLKLYEVSLVPIPANDLTSIIDAKAAGDDDEPDAKADDDVSEKDAEDAADAMTALEVLAERLSDISDALDDMVERLSAIIAPIVDAAGDMDRILSGISATESKGGRDDNAEGAKSANAEADAEVDDMLARMARYIEIDER